MNKSLFCNHNTRICILRSPTTSSLEVKCKKGYEQTIIASIYRSQNLRTEGLQTKQIEKQLYTSKDIIGARPKHAVAATNPLRNIYSTDSNKGAID